MDEAEGPVKAEVLDAITEAVVMPEDPADRAHVVAGLVEEIEGAIAWRLEREDDSHGEEASLRRVVDEASGHETRMKEDVSGADSTQADDEDRTG